MQIRDAALFFERKLVVSRPTVFLGRIFNDFRSTSTRYVPLDKRKVGQCLRYYKACRVE